MTPAVSTASWSPRSCPQRTATFFSNVNVGAERRDHGAASRRRRALPRAVAQRSPINAAGDRQPAAEAGAAATATGVVHAPLQPGGPMAISAYRTLGDPPLVVAVSLSEEEVLADWHRQRRVSAAAFGALTLTLGDAGGCCSSAWSMRASAPSASCATCNEQESERLREANDRLAAALEREQRAQAGNRGRQLPEGRVPDDGVARAAHAADGDLRLGARARHEGDGARRSRRARSPRSSATPTRRRAHRRPARRVARDQRQAAARRARR